LEIVCCDFLFYVFYFSTGIVAEDMVLLSAVAAAAAG